MPNLFKRIHAATVAMKAAFSQGDWISSNLPGNRYSSSRGGYDWNPGTALNYAALAGDLWNNSAVQAVLNWLVRAWPESYPCVKQLDAGGKKVVVDKHPLTEILLNPNVFDDDTVLWSGTIVSFWVDGNAYWRINRTRGGQIAEFEYVPHWSITPKKRQDSYTPGPDYYELSTHNGPVPIPTYDIVHFRFGKDPYNALLGMSPWASVCREVYTDNEAVNYVATTLRNGGKAWMIVSPKDAQSSFDDPKQIRDLIEERTTGDNRNRVLVLDGATDITIPPPFKDMGIDSLRRIPETRICALAGIPAMAVGLAAGLERSTFANTEQAEGAAWNTIVAVQRMLGRQLTKQVLWTPENYNQPANTIFAGFDYSEVRALQPDTAGEWERIGKAYDRGLIDDDEARADMGLEKFTAAQRATQEARAQAALAANAPAPGRDRITKPTAAAASNGNGTGKAHAEPELASLNALVIETDEAALAQRIRKQIADGWQIPN